MKQTSFIFLFVLMLSALNAQSSFDNLMEELAKKTAIAISEKGKTKVAVWYFVNTAGEETAIGKFIAEDFSVYLTNAGTRFHVMDRYHLDQILKEHKLNAEGFINPETAKELGRINAVDAIVTGTVSVLNDKIKVVVKVLDTETALQVSANIQYLPIDDNVKSFLGVPSMGSSGSNNQNLGFNRPLNSDEHYNNPETVNKECAKNETGDYCFTNKTSKTITLRMNKLQMTYSGVGENATDITIQPFQTQCYYNLREGSWSYKAWRFATGNEPMWEVRGNVSIEQCKSKTFEIK